MEKQLKIPRSMESSHWKLVAEGNPAKQLLPQNNISKNRKRTLENKTARFFKGLN